MLPQQGHEGLQGMGWKPAGRGEADLGLYKEVRRSKVTSSSCIVQGSYVHRLAPKPIH